METAKISRVQYVKMTEENSMEPIQDDIESQAIKQCIICFEPTDSNYQFKCVRCNECLICNKCVELCKKNKKYKCPVCKKPSEWCQHVITKQMIALDPPEIKIVIDRRHNTRDHTIVKGTFNLCCSLIIVFILLYIYLTFGSD